MLDQNQLNKIIQDNLIEVERRRKEQENLRIKGKLPVSEKTRKRQSQAKIATHALKALQNEIAAYEAFDGTLEVKTDRRRGPRTEEFRQRLSQIMKEYYEEHPPTEESNRKRSEALMGHDVSDDTRAKMAAHAKERADRGELDYLYTEELNQSRSQKLTDVWATRNGMTPERKEELRRLYTEEGVSFSELGRRFGIDRKTAARIVKEGT